MTRRKSSDNQNATKISNQLTEKEVWDVFEFAKNASAMYNNGLYNGIYNPELINSRMKDITMNPLSATDKAVEQALSDPKNNEDSLIGFSEFFEYTSMLYKRALLYMGNMLSFDLTYTCINGEMKDFSSSEYKKDLQIVEDFLNKFNIKKEFKKVSRQLLRQETFYSVFRDDGKQYVLQELPRKYSKITGRWEYGLLFDFNMMYFISQAGVDIEMYPPIFKAYYDRIMDAKINGYNPASQSRDGEWVYWVQTSPSRDNVWAWKFNFEQAGEVPFLSPMFSDLVLAPMVRKLQTNKYMLQAQKMIIGLIPMLKEKQTGNVKDMMSISPETLGKFLGLLRNSISDVVNIGAVPFADAKAIDFDVDPKNIYQDYTSTTGSSSGINSRMLFSADKQNVEETRNSVAIDEYLMKSIYPYFEDFLNYHINRRTKKFIFKFAFEGSELPASRKERLETALKLVDKGLFLPQKIAASMGMLPHDFKKQLEMAKSDNYTELLTPLINIYNTTNDKGGRPETDTPADSTDATRATGANDLKTGG